MITIEDLFNAKFYTKPNFSKKCIDLRLSCIYNKKKFEVWGEIHPNEEEASFIEFEKVSENLSKELVEKVNKAFPKDK